MKTKNILIKLVALLLVSIMLFTALISCSKLDDEGGESSDVTDEATGDVGDDENDENNGDTNSSIVLFEDGEYKASVVRHELAESFDKTFYTDLRSLLNKRVGKNPSMATDFVASGQELNDGPAILVGDTDYPESKAVIKGLKDGQAKAVIKGNKYVIAYTSEASGLELFEKLKTLINKQPKDKIVIDSKWNITVKLEAVKFDESGLKTSISLPDISSTGLKWNTNGRDAGHGSKIYIANNANSTHFSKYVAALKSAGFTQYTTNKLHTNEFATFVTKEQIVNVMFFEAKSVIKVVVDPRSTFGLPGLKGEEVYAKPTVATEFVQLGMKQVSGSSENGMGYIVKLSNGKFVVVDAGFAWDSGGGGNSGRFIVDTMKKMQGNNEKPVIAAFIITHIHTDHAGGFMGLANACANQVIIEKLIYNQPSDAQMNAVSNMSGRKSWVPNAINKLKNAGSLKSVVKAHPGQQFFIAELTITVLGTIDVIEDSNHTKMKNGNDSSVVTIFEMHGGKVLLLGDAEPQESKIIRDIYGGMGNKNSVLKADFVQVAHHGYGNTNTDYASGNDQNALNVMASGGTTAANSSPIYALVPVGLANGKDPAGYYDAVGHMGAMKIFATDHRLVAADKNLTIKFHPNGTQTVEKTKHSSGFYVGTWTTY